MSFDEIAKEKFGFLETDYNFKLIKCNKTDWGFELLYTNNSTGVKIQYEFQQAYLFIMVYQLENGKFVENPKNITDTSRLHGYALDDILQLRNPASIILPAYKYGADSKFFDPKTGLALFVSIFAENLAESASDLLSGNFEIFEKLDPIVKKRARL